MKNYTNIYEKILKKGICQFISPFLILNMFLFYSLPFISCSKSKEESRNVEIIKEYIKEINPNELKEKIKNKETFVVEFGSPLCLPCQQQKQVLENIARERGLIVYFVDVSKYDIKQLAKKTVPITMMYRKGASIKIPVADNASSNGFGNGQINSLQGIYSHDTLDSLFITNDLYSSLN